MRQVLSTVFSASAALAIGGFSLSSGTAFAALASSEPVTGTWTTADGGSRVRIAPCGPAFCANIVWVKPRAPDDNSPAAIAKSNMVGRQISGDLRRADDGHLAGSILDPESGKTYNATVTLKNANALEMGGCILGGFLCGSETWTRAPEDVAVATTRSAGKAAGRVAAPSSKSAPAAQPAVEPED